MLRRVFSKPLNIKHLMKNVELIFASNNISEPKESAKIIIEHALTIKKFSFGENRIKINSSTIQLIKKLIFSRLRGLPIQYVIGEWDFYGHIFKMQSPIFIPRPETELLVDLALNEMHSVKSFIEFGCGSGVISISLLSKLANVTGTCIDLNPDACQLTLDNAIKLNVSDRLKILNSSFKDFAKKYNDDKFDLLISNPPYIPSSDIPFLQNEVKNYEDHLALDGGEDGLQSIIEILKYAPQIIKKNASIWLETNDGHPKIIKDLIMKDYFNELDFIQHHYDFQDKMRFCHLKVKLSK